MKRRVITVLIIVVCFLLECTVFQKIAFASITPNLLIVITSAFGFMRGKKEGMFVGFLSGLLVDIFFSELIGFYALVFMLIGYVNGFFKRIFYAEDIKLPLILIAASDFIYGHIVCIFMFIIRSRFNYLYYLNHIIMPELIYTILVTLILYQLILHINQKLERHARPRDVSDRRQAGTFPRDPPRPRAPPILAAPSAKPRRQRTHDVTAALSSLQPAPRAPSFSSRPVTRRPGGVSGHTHTRAAARPAPTPAWQLSHASPRACGSAPPPSPQRASGPR